MADPVGVLDFWLGELGPEGWYAGGEEIDRLCRERFLDLWQAAREGGLEHWVEGTVGSLAYLVVTDQLPRNIHRGTALAFATDAQALAAAKRAVAEGWDMGAPEPERQFFYLPFMHSETPADQAAGETLMRDRLPGTGAGNVLHARAHREIITRFGRFPARNAALGRADTPEEEAFVAGGGYGSVVRRLEAEGAGEAKAVSVDPVAPE
jgi:uncharacterized protein (DUF924 family)